MLLSGIAIPSRLSDQRNGPTRQFDIMGLFQPPEEAFEGTMDGRSLVPMTKAYPTGTMPWDPP